MRWRLILEPNERRPMVVGAPLVAPDGQEYVRETRPGRVEREAVFRVVDGVTGGALARERRLVVQVRVAVGIRYLAPAGPATSDREVAVAGHIEPDEGCTWVQTITFCRNRVQPFGDTEREWQSTDFERENAASSRGLAYYTEPWGTRTFLDANPRSPSPRYAARGVWARPLQHARGEILYDAADTGNQLRTVMQRQPDLERIQGRIEFRDYLFRYPDESVEPLLVVVRYQDEVYTRSRPGAPPERASSADPWTALIWPNPMVHPDLTWMIGRPLR